MKKKVSIDENYSKISETYSKEEYDRKPVINLHDKNWKIIYKELKYFKLHEMDSHINSIGNISI